MKCNSGAQICEAITPVSCLCQISRSGASVRPLIVSDLRMQILS